jgi:hypothetical protein
MGVAENWPWRRMRGAVERFPEALVEIDLEEDVAR